MFDTKMLDELSKKFTESLPPALQSLKSDLEQNFKTTLQYTFSQLDLVTREEFDVQSEVLAKTREKVEALEKRISELEAQLLKDAD